MTWTGLLHSVPTVTARTPRAPTAATVLQVTWPRQAPHTALPRSSSEGSVWTATWKWAPATGRGLEEAFLAGKTSWRSRQKALHPSSQPDLPAFQLSQLRPWLWASITAFMPPCPCLAQTPPNALMLQPLAARISVSSVLALLWDAYQRMALIHPLKLHKHARSFGLLLQTRFPSHDPHNILMIPQLGQRSQLPRYGPSVSLEQKRIGGSLGHDSKSSS